jgi:hypothetical protein
MIALPPWNHNGVGALVLVLISSKFISLLVRGGPAYRNNSMQILLLPRLAYTIIRFEEANERFFRARTKGTDRVQA